MSPTAVLTRLVGELPMRRPIQWAAVNAASIAMAATRG